MSWSDFEAQDPEPATFGAARLTAAPAYLASVRSDRTPRVHPVAPVLGGGRLFLFMEPTSPKGRDLRHPARYALHNAVPDTLGTGGEFFISGRARRRGPRGRSLAADAAGYRPPDRYVLFELDVDEARCVGYGDAPLPLRTRWRST